MAQAVIMPKLGQATEESSIVQWHKKEGDPVRKGEILFEMETDKAVLEAESFFEGTLLRVLVPEGVTVPVSTVVAYVGEKGEKVPDAPPPVAVPAAAPTPAPAAAVRQAASAAEPAAPARATPAARPEPVQPQKFFISPRARALAAEKLIDPSRVRGTGPNGRVLVRDIEAYLKDKGYERLRITASARELAAREKVDVLAVRANGEGQISIEDIRRTIAERPRPLSKMRQVIAKRLTESFTTTPHFYVTVSADLTDLLAFRQELKAQGAVYSVTDFILQAVIQALVEFPLVNSVTDGRAVRWHGRVDLGMAVGLDDGLVVPVIRNADVLGLREIHDLAESLGNRAREGKLTPDEMTGSTFTVSNMGMLDVENFHAIINPGEAAILATSSTKPTVVAKDGEIRIRSIMRMTLSADHRIVDGKTGAAFVNAIRHRLEDVEIWKSLT